MKKFYAFSTVILIAVFAIFSAPNVQSNENGAVLNYSGALNLGTCVQSGCHNTTAVNSGPGDVNITTNIPVSGYIPSSTYTVEVEVVSGGANGDKYGFAISSKKVGTNTLVGTWGNVNSNAQIKSSGSYATHTLSGNAGGTASKVFELTWIAPPAGAGKVAMYVAGNSANGNGESTGDHIYAKFIEFDEDNVTSVNNTPELNVKVFPNPSSGILNIEYNAISYAMMSIYTITGQKMLSKELNNGLNQIDLNNLNSGLYLLKLKDGDKESVQRIIIE